MTTKNFIRGFRWALAIAISCLSQGVNADTGDTAAAARALFDQGRQLATDNKYSDACPKFEESQRLAPGMGTQFNLADCYEHVNRTATAWALFLDVASLARQAGQRDRETIARARAASLEPKLAKLIILVSSEVPGMEVKRDGAVMGKVLWGTAIPVDPGTLRIEVSAPGRLKWTTSILVPNQPGETQVTVPLLELGEDSPAAPLIPPSTSPDPLGTPTLTPPPAMPTAPAKPASDQANGQRLAGMITAGAGVVGLGVGAAFLWIGKGKYDDSLDHCPQSKNQCDSAGVSLRDDARSAGNVASLAFGIGAAAVAGGAVLWFTSPSTPSTKDSSPGARPSTPPYVALVPSLSGAMLTGSF